MKKIFITFFFLILMIQNTFAECSIKDSPAQVLNDYISNLRKVVNNVTKDLASSGKDNSTLLKVEQDFIRSMNTIIDFDGYYSSFEFTTLEITNEVPYEVKRDRVMLKNELRNLQNYLERIVRRGYSNNLVKNACSGVENCSLSGNGQQVITELIKNTENVISLFESSILGDASQTDNKFILVPTNFRDEVIKYYNKSTLSDCSLSDGGFWDRASKAMEKISLDSQYMKDATKKWIDAWNLLTGKVSKEEERQLEKDLLRKELSRQGLPANQAQVIMNNLEKYNQNGGYSLGNNFFANSFNSMANAGGKFISSFGSFVTGLADVGNSIGAIFSTDTTKGGVSNEVVNAEVSKKDDTKAMFETMQKLYAENLNYAGQETTVDEKIVDEVVELHISLSRIAETLNSTIQNSQNACNAQCINKGGNCTDYKP
nr:hypothetical protein [Candidatus Gracilibacteria bacterium]